MRTTFLSVFSMLLSLGLAAQFKNSPESYYSGVSTRNTGFHLSENLQSNYDAPFLGMDTAKHDFYGDLVNDDSFYNKKYPLWEPALEAFSIDAATVAMDRYILKADYAHISLNSWRYNLKTGWVWDVDGFGINFFCHPYSGSLTFNAGRSTGYN